MANETTNSGEHLRTFNANWRINETQLNTVQAQSTPESTTIGENPF